MSTPLWTIIVVILSTVIGAFGAINLKRASKYFSLSVKFFFNKHFILGIFFYAISTIIFIITLKFGELSVLFPAVATIYISISLLSKKYFGEEMNLLKWLGIFFIILGVSLLGIGA